MRRSLLAGAALALLASASALTLSASAPALAAPRPAPGKAAPHAAAEPAPTPDHPAHMVLQLDGPLSARFAGYYVAQARGLYKAAGLDVTLRPGALDADPAQSFSHGADVAVDGLAAALIARQSGVPLVNIAQVFQQPAIQLTCRKDSGVAGPQSLPGATIGAWPGTAGLPLRLYLARLGLRAAGPAPLLTLMRQGQGAELLLQKKAACITTLSYDGYWTLVESGMTPDQLVTIPLDDPDAPLPADGLYAPQERIANPAAADRLARFVRASLDGWRWAAEHPAEAAQMVMAANPDAKLAEAHQQRMAAALPPLLAAGDRPMGTLDPATYERAVKLLMATKMAPADDPAKLAPVLTRPPRGAWTHDILDKANAPGTQAGNQAASPAGAATPNGK